MASMMSSKKQHTIVGCRCKKITLDDTEKMHHAGSFSRVSGAIWTAASSVRSTGDGDPVGWLGGTAIGLAVEPVASPAGTCEPSAESVARIEGVSVGDGELVAIMLKTRPSATAATSKSATNHGLDRADRRFIWLHQGFGCLG